MLFLKRAFLAATLLATALAVSTGPAAAAPGLQTALVPNERLTSANYQLEYSRIKAAGATAVRPSVSWAEIAPDRPSNPANPADPAYDWSSVDEEVRLARANGLEPILLVYNAPRWAQAKIPPGVPHTDRDGPFKPSPTQFGKFARAVALRYGGNFEGLPRVRYFIAWNEPNIYRYLTPQTLNGEPFSPLWYRKLLTAFSKAVHGVHADNRVVAGALAQFGIGRRISPLLFMRDLLCLSNDKKPRATCKAKLSFDVWSHHPYTRGDAFHKAQGVDDVSLGDLPKMHDLLTAAVRAGKVRSKTKVQFWVDEFSWDSRPPDPSKLVVPILLHARWVSESLYQMWLSGVSLGTWFLLRDDPTNTSALQSGLWFNGSQDSDLSQDWPKPALTAFRFPFVAYRKGKTVSLWGRTPKSRSASVAVEIGTAFGWRRIAVVRAGGNGVFTGKLRYAGIPNLTRASAISRSYQSNVKADKPRSYWRLDERSGSVARDEMGSANGSYEGNPKRGVAGALKAKVDKAVQFSAGTRVELPTMGPPRTVELWLKTSAKGNLPAISFRDGVSGSLYVGPVTRGFAQALADGNSGLGSFNAVNDGVWHHVVYTLRGDQAQLYVDGRLNSQTSWQPQWDSGQPSLGYDTLQNRYFKGALDEVAVYDHALSAKQIARHYAASGRQVATVGMLRARVGSNASWPFSLRRPPDRFVLAFG